MLKVLIYKALYNIIDTFKKGSNNMNKLDVERIREEKQILKVGELNNKIIDILELEEKPRNIKFAYDRIAHCEDQKKILKTNNHIIKVWRIYL